MIALVRRYATWIVLGGALTLAATSGVLAAVALGVSSQSGPPTTTTTINVGTGQQGPPGPPGPPGAGIQVKGQVATAAGLPATGNKPGDTYLVTADHSIQTWDGSKWVSSGPIPAAELVCPVGSQFEAVVLDHPGGHVTIWTCVAP